MAKEFTDFSRRLNTGGGVLAGHGALEDVLSLFLVQSIIIIAICRALSIIGQYFKQPKVIFEIIGGILLGPTAIGRAPGFLDQIFPDHSLPYLKLVSDIGLLLYLFIVGMELDVPKLATHAKKAGGVAIMGMAVPFALGIAISQTMFDNLQAYDPKYANVKPTSFFVFIGTALSITAFPVLARILKEGGLIYSKVGALVMGAAALNDAVAWCLLILAISIANAKDMAVAGYVFLSVAAFAIGLLVVVEPVLHRFVTYMESFNSRSIRNHLFALTLIMVFICAWTTALLGLDAIFGAFLFGLIIPRESQLFHDCHEFIEELILTFTLPLYFALSGLKTDITQITTTGQGAMIVLVCFIATIGKFIGAGGCALVAGMTVRESATVAVLMNTRGLVELIVLNLGMQSGILNTKTFSVMVIMCLFTTFMTCPLLEYIYPPHYRTLMTDDKGPSRDDDIDDEIALGESSSKLPLDLSKLARNVRFSIVIDRLEHLQGLMDLISSLAPYEIGSKLSVNAIRFEEPSNTLEDEFLGLNTENRLVSVFKEPTTISENVKSVSPLLPLSMMCKAIGGTVSVYDVKGDPNEFPMELKTLATKSHSNFIVVPWRSGSDYFQELFWGAVHKCTVPLALFVQVEEVAAVPSHPRRMSFLSEIGLEMISAKKHHTNSTNGTDDGEHKPNVGIEFTALPSAGPGINTGVSGLDDGDDEGGGMDSSHRCIVNVLALVTGSAIDSSLFPLLLRMMERVGTNVTVMTTSNRKAFPDNVKESLGSFKQKVAQNHNIRFVKLNIAPDCTDLLAKECNTGSYDLCIHSFIETKATHSAGGVDDIESHTRGRSNTLTIALQTIMPPTGPETKEKRLKWGMPENIADSALESPELGELGHRLKEAGSIRQLLIFHEPTSPFFRRNRAMTLAAMSMNEAKRDRDSELFSSVSASISTDIVEAVRRDSDLETMAVSSEVVSRDSRGSANSNETV